MHRTERGSAGSTPISSPYVEVEPALPRSVLCVVIALGLFNLTFLVTEFKPI
ncbi:MAG TPA: hypothetical protein VKB05_08380 [Pyrinomonadaceae bacterium]|nr:hypothetical protein [Pyrinomonadaceae bacterium]